MQKIVNFYSRIYYAAFPPSYAARQKKPPTFQDSIKWATLFAFTVIMSCLVALGVVALGVTLLGPVFAILFIFFSIVSGMTFLFSRIS